MSKIAFLGTGLMGAALAEAAAKRGDDVVAWNRTKKKAEALAPFGVRAASSPAEAVAGVERVHVMLSDDAAVDAVLADLLANAAAAMKTALVVDHSTVSPAGTAARAKRMEDAGVAFLHAPVLMSPAACRAASGLMLAAGPRAVFERARPALEPMTGKVLFLGERRDLAAANKLFANAMIIANTAGLADVFAMAKGLGIAAPDARAIFDTFNPAVVVGYRGGAMAKGDYTPSFELTMARKDVRLMLETAGDAPLAVLPAVASRMDALVARGLGGDDMGVLAVDVVPKA